jgi:hypothetical protein
MQATGITAARQNRRGQSRDAFRARDPNRSHEASEDTPLALIVDDVDDNRDLYATSFSDAGLLHEEA